MSDGRVILITGAGRGIGAAVARRLAAPGRLLALNYLSRRDSAQAVARDVEAKGGRGLLLPADVTSASAVEDMFAALAERAGRLDVLISNAGAPFRYGRLPECSPADFEAQWRVQAGAAFLCCRAAVPLLKKSPAGRIVFVVSNVAQGAPPAFMAHYVSAKYALWGLAQALKAELSGKGIRVDCVFPPMTRTDFIKNFPRPIVEAAREASPGGRLPAPEETAAEIARVVEAET
ncbi:MAG: SDR family NAD(P)-dependent oxidoreductase [Elusimicrobia bacterium]|nr:SDR family NAD(P)-dependent oxidoreductase [Elusimicrobiota bacterium]